MIDVIMSKYRFLNFAVPDAFDQGCMIQGIGEDVKSGNQVSQSAQGSIICNVARCEHQRLFLIVNIGQLAFELCVVRGGTRYVAGTSCTRTTPLYGFGHCLQYDRMLTHTKIIV